MNKLTTAEILAWASGEDVQSSLVDLEEEDRRVALAGVRTKRVAQVREALGKAIQIRRQGIAVEIAQLSLDAEQLRMLADDQRSMSRAQMAKLERANKRTSFNTFTLAVPELDKNPNSDSYTYHRDTLRAAIAPLLGSRYHKGLVTSAARLILEGQFPSEFVEVEAMEGQKRHILPLVRAVTFHPDENGGLDAQTLLERSNAKEGVGPAVAAAMIDLIANGWAAAQAEQATSTD